MQTPVQPKARQAQPDAIAPEALRPWPFAALTPQQRLERQRMEAALAASTLRGPPTCFGALS